MRDALLLLAVARSSGGERDRKRHQCQRESAAQRQQEQRRPHRPASLTTPLSGATPAAAFVGCWLKGWLVWFRQCQHPSSGESRAASCSCHAPYVCISLIGGKFGGRGMNDAELRLRQGQLVALGRTLSTFRSDAKLRRRCPPQRPGRNETPAGKGSGGCSDDPRK